MSRDTPEIVAARIEVERSRARLMDTAHALQERISPRTLAHNAWEGAKMKGADFAEDAVDAVRSRPLTTAGVVAAITLFLAREPVMDLAGKLVDGAKAKGANRRSRKAKKDDKPIKVTETSE